MTDLDPGAIVRAALDGIDHEIIPCDPELADTAAFCRAYDVPLRRSANTIVVASRRPPGRLAVCVVLATHRLDVNRRVRDRLGVSKVSFATADQTMALTGMAIGGVSPFGLPDEVPLWIDADVLDEPWVVVGGGSRSFKVKVAPGVLTALPNGTVVDQLAVLRPD